MIAHKPHHKTFKPRTTGLNRIGRKGKLNKANNAELKKQFIAMGITTCELNLMGCMRNTMLSFAHSKKRRHFETAEDWTEALLSCTKCHEFIEHLGESKMTEIVRDVISRRTI
jgi:hypothetical protein